MAHLIEEIDGKAAMAYAGQTPWHGLGTEVSPDILPMEMLDAASLNWSVEKVPSFITFKGEVKPTGKECLVRSTDGKVLTTISKDWEPIQNIEAFEFFNEFVKQGNMKMHTAGSLREGKLVWALAKIEESFSLFKGKDTVESYLLFTNPHEYGISTDVRFTPIRVVCNNTLTLSLSSKADMAVKVNHRNKFDSEQVKQTLGIAHSKLADYKKAAEFLAKKKVSKEGISEYIKNLFPVIVDPKKAKADADNDNLKLSRPARQILEIMDTQPGHELGAGTYWQAFNGVTYAIDHVFGRSPESRLHSSWYGFNRGVKIKALNQAMELAQAA